MADADQGPIGPYAHLAPELRSLPAEARAIWGDPDERRRALEAILDAWERRVPVLDATIRRVDDAVVAGLAALGFPRGEVRAIELDVYGRQWTGQKRPDCVLALDAGVLTAALRSPRGPDGIVKTWVHESLHARQAYTVAALAEYRRWSRYEEGLAEGLARVAVMEKAGIRPPELSYDGFVTTWRRLAAAAGIEVERLWSELWKEPAGRVREAFVTVVDMLIQERGSPKLTITQQGRLRIVADRLFAAGREGDRVDRDLVDRLWRSALL